MQDRHARVMFAAAAAIVFAYIVVAWSQSSVPPDFSQQYVAGTLLRTGHGADLYSVALQNAVRKRFLPASSGSLQFVYSPAVAFVAAPFTLLDPRDAFRAWSAAQLAMIVAAVVIATRAAPVVVRDARSRLGVAAVAACAGYGTAVLLALGQIDGLQTLGIALAYSEWRRGRHSWGGFWLAVTVLTGKPHLAFGLAAFLLGWQDRRVLQGAIVGAVTAFATFLLTSGVGGTAAFVRAAASQLGEWHLATMPALIGLAGSWLGDTLLAHAAAAAASVVAVAIAFLLGRVVRSDRLRLEPALVGAALLSQLAAPHTYAYDLVLLAPLAGIAMATAIGRDRTAPRAGASRLTVIGWLWLAINLAAYADATDAAHAPPGQLTAWVLLVAAATAIRAAGGLRHHTRRTHDAVHEAGTPDELPEMRAAHIRITPLR
jgi:hypothetical protein